MSGTGPGTLRVVATPIGNLEDITLRALRVLREADLVLAEDTRRTRQLCSHHGIDTPLRALHAHSDERALQRCVDDLQDGKNLALVSDAGTPIISDPGAELVRRAASEGLSVEAIPGASAVSAALVVSGVPTDSFRFVGFLPRSGGKRRRALEQIGADRSATVLFESPNRLAATLGDLANALGEDRRLAVCRELTKLHEEVVRGTAAEVLAHFAEGARGEITLVVAGNDAPVVAQEPEDLDEQISALLEDGHSVRDVAQALADQTGLKRRDLYARVQTLADRTEED